MDTTHEGSLDDLQPGDLQEAGGDGRDWRMHQREPRKYSSHFQTIRDEANHTQKHRLDHQADRHWGQNVNASSMHRQLASLESADVEERASQKETIYRHEEEEEAAKIAVRTRGQRHPEAKAGKARQGRAQRYEEQDLDDESASSGAQHPEERGPWDGEWAGQRKAVERYRSGGRTAEAEEGKGQSGYMQARNAGQMKPVKQRRPSRRAASSSDGDY